VIGRARGAAQTIDAIDAFDADGASALARSGASHPGRLRH
jgi:hypothetical protein